MNETTSIHDLIPDDHNANKGTDRGREMLQNILRKYGAARSIVLDRDGRIIAGNKTVEAAGAAGLENVVIVKSDGTKLIAVQRTDLTLDDPKAREIAAADNRAGELGLEWDPAELQWLNEQGIDLAQFFPTDELDALLASNITPAFEPIILEDDQYRLDQRSKCKCPECGHEFVPD